MTPKKPKELNHPSIQSRANARRETENKKIAKPKDFSTEAELVRLMKEWEL